MFRPGYCPGGPGTRDHWPSHLINSTNVNPLPRTISGNRSEGQASGYMEGREGREGRGDTGGQVWLVAMPGRPGLVSVGQPASRVSLVSWPGLDSNETWPVVATHSTLHSRILRHKGN